MRTTTTVKVEGLQGCLKNLETMETKIAKKIVKDAARAGGQIILRSVQGSIYRGLTPRTGLLKEGLSVTVGVARSGQRVTAYVKERQTGTGGKSELARVSLAAAMRHARTGGRVAPRFGAFYWRFLEFGVAARQTAGGANRGALPATANVRGAFSSSSGIAIDRFKDVLIAGVNSEVQQLPSTKGSA